MPSWLLSNNNQGLRVPPLPSAILFPPSLLPRALDQNCKNSCRWCTSYRFGACSHSLPYGESLRYTAKILPGRVGRTLSGPGGPGSHPSRFGHKMKRGRYNPRYAPVPFSSWPSFDDTAAFLGSASHVGAALVLLPHIFWIRSSISLKSSYQ